MKAVLFAVLIFATASTSGTPQRTSEHSCTRFNCATDTGVTAGEMVNRNGKGDRLPLIPAFHPNERSLPVEINVTRTPDPDQQLLDGCESLASPLSHSLSAQIAGRCVS